MSHLFMPQFDKLTFFSQIFYFCLIFSFYYFYANHKYVHVLVLFTKVRNKKKQYHLSLSSITSGLVSFLNDSLNKTALLVNSLNTSLEKFTSNYLTFLNLDQKKVVLAINKNIALNNLSVYEETFNAALKPKKIKLNKKNFKFNSNFNSFSGLSTLKGSNLNFKRGFSTSSRNSVNVGFLQPPILYWPKRYPYYIRPLKKPEPLPWIKERRERTRLRLLHIREERRAKFKARFPIKLERRLININLDRGKRLRKLRRKKKSLFKNNIRRKTIEIA